MTTAATLGRKGGLKGGPARARSMSAAERSESARRAAVARWGSRPERELPRKRGSTREKIFRAAAAEFLRHGFEGARVERIVDRAGVNKRMLYHYFGSKEGLYRELLTRNLTDLHEHDSATPQTLGDSFAYWQELMLRNPEWVRASILEALSSSRTHIAHREREAFWQHAVEELRAAQKAGAITSALDAASLQLALVAIVMFPLLLPQFTRFITGTAPTDAQFAKRQIAFLRQFAELLR
jgi:AcrR family transcriptional regulator